MARRKPKPTAVKRLEGNLGKRKRLDKNTKNGWKDGEETH